MARKRKAGARTRSGRISRAYAGPARDVGTADLRRHRLALVNGAHDPALSATLAGIMLAHGILSPEQHVAAQRYRQLRGALYGCPLARNEGGVPAPDPDRILKLQQAFDALVRRLSPQQK